MNVIISILLSSLAFIVGFNLGLNKSLSRNIRTYKKTNVFAEDSERIKREYRNFLNYDGSEQA